MYAVSRYTAYSNANIDACILPVYLLHTAVQVSKKSIYFAGRYTAYSNTNIDTHMLSYNSNPIIETCMLSVVKLHTACNYRDACILPAYLLQTAMQVKK